MRLLHVSWVIAGLALSLAGCKGGGSDGSTTITADGIYAGTLTPGNQTAFTGVIGAVNRDGVLRLVDISTSYQYSGQLTVNSAAGTASGPLQVFDATGAPATTGTLTASFTPSSQISATYTLASGETGSLVLNYNGQYGTATTLATAAGGYQWTSSRNNGRSTLTFGADGTLGGTTEYGCPFTGTATVANASFDLFNVTLNLAGTSACGGAGTALSGLAYYAPLYDGTHNGLILIASNALGGTFAEYQKQPSSSS